MAAATTMAIVGAAIIGAGSAYYQGEEQKKLAKEDASRRKTEADAAKAEADRIARETKPEEEGLGEIGFGSGDDDMGSPTDFLVPKNSSGGGLGQSEQGSGLGFKL